MYKVVSVLCQPPESQSFDVLAGAVVGIDLSGKRIAVGAPGANSVAGTTYVLDQVGGSWSTTPTLTQVLPGGSIILSPNDYYGGYLGMSSAGDLLVSSASGYNGAAGTNFDFWDTGLTAQFDYEGEVTPNTLTSGDSYGFTVAVSGSGYTVLSGAPFTSSAAGAWYTADYY